MKRPNRGWRIEVGDGSIQIIDEIKIYIDDLEKYCDELEKQLEELSGDYLVCKLSKYEKALDKACGDINAKTNWATYVSIKELKRRYLEDD